MVIAPTFDELATMSVIDHDCTGCGSCSVKMWFATLIWLPIVRWSVGCIAPESRAPATVIILLTDPGSNTSVSAIARLLGRHRAQVAVLLHLARQVGHRQELTGLGLHDDRHAAVRPRFHDLVRQ